MSPVNKHLRDTSIFYINPLFYDNYADSFSFNDNFEFKG